MSVNLYARQVPLHDVCGRADYISSNDRQEHLLATASTVSAPDYWQHLAADCQLAFRQAGGQRTKENGEEVKACEGREIHVQLPNSALKKMSADQLAQKLANDFKSRYGVDCLVAIHYNGTESNLHFHLMFSERQALETPEIKIADRNVFLDANGIRKRTKKEILDADGQLLPGCSIVKKGEVLSARYFGEKDATFSSKAWMDDYRHYMADWINVNLEPDELRTVFDPASKYLAQRHVGKGNLDMAPGIKAWNNLVKRYNRLVDAGYVDEERAEEVKERIRLSPDQNRELDVIICEIMREAKPQTKRRAEYDRTAAWAATPTLSNWVENRDEKQKLRELYKDAAEVRRQIADATGDLERSQKRAELRKIYKEIDKQRAKALEPVDLRKARKIGRELGFTRKEVTLIYDAIPYLNEGEWTRIWRDAEAGIKQYREKLQELARAQAEYQLQLAEWRRYQKYRWILDPRNHSQSLLGIVVAIIALSFMRKKGEILSDREYAWAVKRGLINDIRGKKRVDPAKKAEERMFAREIQRKVDAAVAVREWRRNGCIGPKPGTEPPEEIDFMDAAEQIENQWQKWEQRHPELMRGVAERKQTSVVSKNEPPGGHGAK